MATDKFSKGGFFGNLLKAIGLATLGFLGLVILVASISDPPPPESEQLNGNQVNRSHSNTSGTIPINQAGESGGRSVMVTELTIRENGLPLDNPFSDPIHGRIAIVALELANISQESGNFAFSSFELEDAQGRTYSEISDVSYAIWRNEQNIGSRVDDYDPGEARQEAAAFRVAPDASGFQLTWKGKTFETQAN